MIIAAQQNDIVKSGFDNSKKATINQDKLAKLQHLLTKGLYSDPISAVLVEWTNNAVDSVVQAGKNPIEHPVLVKITENKLIVEDKGTGLNKEQFENVCMSYLSSTKEESNDVIGAFGIGMKSFMSLDRSATFTCRKDGKEWKFLAYQGVEFMEYDLLAEVPTDKENGVVCELSINGWSEFTQFRDKAKQKLAYYDTVVLQIQNNIINNQIIRSKDWQYSEYADYNHIHLCLKDVLYKIDWDKLGIATIYTPIALRFNLSEGLKPTPSRESLIWDVHTINLVKEKIKKVADYFVEKYNEQQKDEYELLEVFDKIPNSDKYVTLGNENFKINDLLQYATITPKELKIKGINVMKPKYYYNLKGEYLDEYETLADYNRSKWSVKHVKTNHDCNKLLAKIKHIEVDRVPTGLIKKFLLEKYTDNRVLFIKKVNTRKLGNIRFKYSHNNLINYTDILNLDWGDKQNWRNKISEFQFVENQFKSLIINELNVETSNDYLTWLAKYKEEQKNNKKLGIYRGNHKVLNKQQGDVTLGIIEEKEIGTGYKINKKVFKIETFHRIPKLHVIFKEENKERAKLFAGLFGVNKFKFATIGKNEYLKVKNMHNIKTEEEFIKCKAFRKVATSILFEDLIKEYDKMFDKEAENIISQLIKPLENDVNILKNYINKNVKRIKDNELLEALLETAKEFNLYDFEFWDVYLRVKEGVKKYDFLSLIEEPRRWNQEEKRKTQSLINQIIYHRKMYHNQFEELEITVKQPEVTKVEEETILEQEMETV